MANNPDVLFSVSEFLDYINEIFAGHQYSVEGEISDFHMHPVGAFFALKDKNGDGILNCYMNPYAYKVLGFTLEDGMLVKASGRPKMHKPKGKLSFTVDSIELAGEGTLRRAYEALKRKLEEEGVFARKRPVPEFIKRIGIITSKTGAVIDDFRKNLKAFGFEIFLYDVRVEGANAHKNISDAIKWFNVHMPDCDTIVIMRGGGSLEDMQPFNNEIVARAIFASGIPVIAGIGHDRDVPIASLASDQMTSTPSFAAAIVNDSWKRLYDEVPFMERDLFDGFDRIIDSVHVSIVNAAEKFLGAMRALHTETRQASRVILRMLSELIYKANSDILSAEKIIIAMNPDRNLKLGYSIILDDRGNVVTSSQSVQAGAIIKARLADGSINARVEK